MALSTEFSPQNPAMNVKQSGLSSTAHTGSMQLTRSPAHSIGEREKFLLFIKIMFQYLERSGKSLLRQRAKNVVTKCIRRNRVGDENYIPLKESVEKHLRPLVGPLVWSRVEIFCELSCEEMQARRSCLMAAV